MRTVAGRYRLVSWDDLEKDDVAVPAVQALGWLGPWLADPDARAEIAEAYGLAGPGGRLAIRHLTESDLHRFVRPLLERALLSGELVLVERAPIAGWKPAIMNLPPEEKAAPVAPPAPAPARTNWIEFMVQDESGSPLAGVRYEAKLTDSSVKTGTTGESGLVRFEGLEAGLCEFRLLDFDASEVGKADGAATGGSGAPPAGVESLEIEMVDDQGEPLGGQRFEVELPDGGKRDGTTEDNGVGRIPDLPAGEYPVSFPELAAGA